ncbi:MAG TPA: hypothetical protein PKE37_07325 [Thiomonas arsenitoxydans]|uniref:hypothetical protein n=1 Tax=Thiomonas TaxID=32012 RepID=UPI002580F1D5|nr:MULTISPECIES: hypothetical protein [Thiomonas]HML81560.1 hypothetical protein [Thiomonas arsenitoxydans]
MDAISELKMNPKPEKSQKMSRTSYLLGIDLDQLKSHKDAAGAALDLEPHSNKIAEMLDSGVSSVTILKIVSARLGVSHHVAVRAIQICLNGTGVEFKLPRGHRPKKNEMGDDLQQAKSVAATAPQPQGAKKTTNDTQPAAPSAPPAPAAKAAGAPARPAPSVSTAKTPSPAPFPDIPRGELTHTERSELAKKWIAAQFGDRHPTQVKPDELTPAAQEWLEKLWDKPAPVNQKTGQPYSFKQFTPDGRITYDEPWWPPEAVAMENSKSGYLPVHDAQTRATIKKYGLHLRTRDQRNVEVVDKNGKVQVGGIAVNDFACLIRQVREIEDLIERQKKLGIPY